MSVTLNIFYAGVVLLLTLSAFNESRQMATASEVIKKAFRAFNVELTNTSLEMEQLEAKFSNNSYYYFAGFHF